MRLSLIHLLSPQFPIGGEILDNLPGINLPEAFSELMRLLQISSLRTAYDESGVVYNGTASYIGGDDNNPAIPQHRSQDGGTLDWGNTEIRFRLNIPRHGSQVIQDAITTLPSGFLDLSTVVGHFGPTPSSGTTPSEYPGIAFRLELLLKTAVISLPTDTFIPARVASDGWLERDPSYDAVKIYLPHISVIFSQTDEFGNVDVEFAGWGVESLDDPANSEAGEAVRMVPPLALNESGVFGFAMEKLVLDFSTDFTPIEILEQFGTGDDFTGLWAPHIRLFFASSKGAGFAFNAIAKDMLIGIDPTTYVSGEFTAELLNREAHLKVEPRLYEGSITRGNIPESENPTTVNSRGHAQQGSELQILITGGYPPYTVQVQRDGSPITPTRPGGLQWNLENPATGSATIRIEVQDSRPTGSEQWIETLELTYGVREASSAPERPELPAPDITPGSGTEGFTLHLAQEQPDDQAVFLIATPSPVENVTADTSPIQPGVGGLIRVPVTPGNSPVEVSATWPTTAVSALRLPFGFEIPRTDTQQKAELGRIQNSPDVIRRIQNFIREVGARTVELTGRASYNFDSSASARRLNQDISDRRAQILRTLLIAEGLPASQITTVSGEGFTDALAASQRDSNYPFTNYQDAFVTIVDPAPSAPTRSVSVSRDPRPDTPEPEPPTERPNPPQPEAPSWFRSMRLRVRLERNRLVLAEISGQIDIDTASEEGTRVISNNSNPGDVPADASLPRPNPGDGIIDYRLTVTFDSSTKRLSQQIVLGAGEADRDGLVSISNAEDGGVRFLGNVLGGLLMFAPLLANSVDSLVDAADDTDNESEILSNSAEIGIAVGTTIVLAATDSLSMNKIILFGGEATLTETVVGDPSFLFDIDDAIFDDLTVLFDYGVDFDVDLNLFGLLRIQSDQNNPLRVRYKALGFRLDFRNSEYIPVFDTSKGYEFDLADPGLFDLGAPLGSIFRILGARVARSNPLVFEFDIGMKVNLGIIRIDSMRVSLPIDPSGPPTLTPAGATLDIPGTLLGKGYLNLDNGVTGSLDISIIPAKLRIMAGLRIEPFDTPDGRHLTGVLATLGVEFPAPVVLFSTGLGLFGVSGLFAMHFKRNEDLTQPVPALHWLNERAHGDPADPAGIVTSGSATAAWVTEADRWSFGIGVVIGTLEGGFTLNLKGMFMLELPGPRILIFVNAKILSEKPNTKGSVTAGILAVVDIDFNLERLLIGLIINYEIKEILVLKVPIEASFNFKDVKDWALNIGRIDAPIEAEVLGLVKAQGYLMFAGKEIANFPKYGGELITLPGLAIAMGIRAAIVLGDESSGLYLKVSSEMNAAVSFSPFYIYGWIDLRGTLRLFIISISAWASLEVESAIQTNEDGTEDRITTLDGEACGEVDLFFFSIKGCVSIHIGPGTPVPSAPPLIKGMVLQSHSPALVEGQGTDRPIDGSLGESVEIDAMSDSVPADALPLVPIDAMPVLQMRIPPIFESTFTTFTQEIEQATDALPEGWVDQGGGRHIRYRLTRLTITPPLPPDDELDPPPAVFRKLPSQPGGSDTNIDLATFSWDPDSTPRAVQRSAELTDRIGDHWAGVCDPAAPPSAVFWTFNQQRLGPSSNGWHLHGISWPDPPNALRSTPTNVRLYIHEVQRTPHAELAERLQFTPNNINLEPAKVIGDQDQQINDEQIRVPGRVLQLPFYHPGIQDIDVDTSEFEKLIQPDLQRIIIECGFIQHIRLLVAVLPELLTEGDIVLRALSLDNTLLDEVPLTAIIESNPVDISDLPPQWQEPSGPWFSNANLTIEYLRLRQPDRERFSLFWIPPEETSRIEITQRITLENSYPPAVILGAVELLRNDEITRADHDAASQNSKIDIVEGAFNAGQLRRLLEPDTTYTVSMEYLAQARQEIPPEEGSGFAEGDAIPGTQHFRFRTDDAPPERLDPWILMTTPTVDESLHFTEDPVTIIFNDRSIIQLFDKYGKELRAVVEKPNGLHPEDEPGLTPESLHPVSGIIQTPYLDTLMDVIQSSDLSDCIHIPGTTNHEVFDLGLELDRKMAYSLEIRTNDPLPEDIRKPLYRIQFKTSRFANGVELADFTRSQPIKHRPLKAALVLPGGSPIDSETSTNVFSLTDIEMQSALMDAGMDAPGPSEEPQVNYLWQPTASGHELVGILIDSPEPLWRFRSEPFLTTTKDGSMEYWAVGPRLYLEIIEDTSNVVNQFFTAAGGTRTLVLLNPGAAEISLKLRQLAPSLRDDLPAQTDTNLLISTLPSEAPWRLAEDA